MAKRTVIGLNYFFDNQSNSGIVNYIYNILAALHTLPDAEKPEVVVFHSANAPVDYLRTIGYPYIAYVLFQPWPENYVVRKANGLVRRLFGKDLYLTMKYFDRVDSLYPYFESSDSAFAAFKHKIYWLVDFNNLAFPQYYGDNGERMLASQEKMVRSGKRVVLSSNTLAAELKQYFPGYDCDIRILRFASSLQLPDPSGSAAILQKYSIDLPYLMSPNQFWEHKNQALVLDALHIVRQKAPDLAFKILFSGSLQVNRGKGLYIDLLKSKVDEYGLSDYISFLGVLERDEQLLLMSNASALLQPSLYEGWSTLVEEAKALNKFIILSDLPVHREQISNNVAFFDPYDANDLAEKMLAQLTDPARVEPVDYSKNIQQYGRDLVSSLTFGNEVSRP